MNLFGNDAADGNGKFVRTIALTAALVVAATVAASSLLERAARDGTLNSLVFWSPGDPARHMANVPKSGQQVGGVRYGNVDYMPTASIPASQQRVKNAVSDPSLGMPN